MEHASDLQRLACLLGTFVQVLRAVGHKEHPDLRGEIVSVAEELEGVAERLIEIAAEAGSE